MTQNCDLISIQLVYDDRLSTQLISFIVQNSYEHFCIETQPNNTLHKLISNILWPLIRYWAITSHQNAP